MPDHSRFHYNEVTSTNDICFEKCQESEKPVVVSADKQTKGRGRNQKDWRSPHGNISYSFGYKSEEIISGTSIKTGLIAANAINKAWSRFSYFNCSCFTSASRCASVNFLI